MTIVHKTCLFPTFAHSKSYSQTMQGVDIKIKSPVCQLKFYNSYLTIELNLLISRDSQTGNHIDVRSLIDRVYTKDLPSSHNFRIYSGAQKVTTAGSFYVNCHSYAANVSQKILYPCTLMVHYIVGIKTYMYLYYPKCYPSNRE